MVRIEGAAGMGKSRLARGLGIEAHATGAAEVLVATHGPVGGAGHGLAPAATAWLGSGDPRRRLPGASDHAVAQLTAWLQGQSLRVSERIDAMLMVLQGATRRRPAVLILDDVHWGSDARRVAARIVEQRLPVLVVATVGPHDDPIDPPLPEGPAIELGPLSDADSERLLQSMIGLEGQLADAVVAHAHGVPLFSIQLLVDWIRRGILVASDQGVVAPRTPAFPRDLHALWLDRLEGLAEGTDRALELGAILGGAVSIEEWSTATQLASLPHDLHEAAQRGLIHLDGDSWTFRFALLRRSLERRCREQGRWASAHRVCADALARIAPAEAGSPVRALRLARHLRWAGDPDQAARTALDAASRLCDLGDFDEADRARGLLTAVLPSAPDALATRLREMIVRLHLHCGRYDDVIATTTQWLSSKRIDPAPGARGDLLRKRANARFLRGDADGAQHDVAAALIAYQAAGDLEHIGDCPPPDGAERRAPRATGSGVGPPRRRRRQRLARPGGGRTTGWRGSTGSGRTSRCRGSTSTPPAATPIGPSTPSRRRAWPGRP